MLSQISPGEPAAFFAHRMAGGGGPFRDRSAVSAGGIGRGPPPAKTVCTGRRGHRKKEETGMSRRSVIHIEAAIDYIESHLEAILPSVLYSLLRYRRRQNE